MRRLTDHNLSRVSETLFIPLYIRAIESERPDALVHDERAVALVRQLDSKALTRMAVLAEDTGRLAAILKGREFDRLAKDFMQRNQGSVVVHLGCGLDTRFERVDDGRVEWYDLDLPEVVALRKELIGAPEARRHDLACSMFDRAWLEEVGALRPRPFLILAEGVFMYFDEAQIRSFVRTLHEHLPGAELAFDAYSPFLRWAHNLRVLRKQAGARLRWSLRNCRDLEAWGEGIHLLAEWYPFQASEPRMRRAWKVRFIPLLARSLGVFHYELQAASHG